MSPPFRVVHVDSEKGFSGGETQVFLLIEGLRKRGWQNVLVCQPRSSCATEACEAKGVDFLDAPVSGGEPMAISGDLAIMVGGKQAVFDRVAPLLEPLGASAVLCGDYGAGNTTKLANQIMVAVNIAGVSEALVLAKKAGLDPMKVFDAIKGGLAGSNVLNAKGPMMMAGNFAPGFRVRLHQKDLRNALLTAGELSVPLPVTSMIQQILGSLMNEGKGDNDHSSIANFIEAMAGTTIAD